MARAEIRPMPDEEPESPPERPDVAQLVRFFGWLGTTGFGGPIALAGRMELVAVDERRWVTRQEFADGLALAQLAPGPLAAQLAIYLGWLCAGVRGASAVAIAFVAPSFVIVVALAIAYQRFGGMAWLQGAFYGIGAAVIAIIARSAAKLAKSTLRRDRLLWVLFAVSAFVTAWTESEIVWVFLLCGFVATIARAPPRSMGSHTTMLALALPLRPFIDVALLANANIVWTVMLYFASAGLFVFGSGLAIVPFLHGGVVVQHHWLTERQFLDAVAVALITPGPVVITVAFIGFLVAGIAGATAAAIGVFAPVYVITIVLAPHYDRVRSNPRVRAFVDGVTAAATGAIAGAAFVLGRRAVTDLPTVLIASGALALLLRAKWVPEPIVIGVAGVLGVLLSSARAS